MKKKERKRKEPEFEFIFENEPDEETIREFHQCIAQGLINKYGAENMKRVLEEYKKLNQ